MLTAEDVVDFVRKTCVILMDETVFAAVIRSQRNFGSELLTDVTGHGRAFVEPAPWPFSECAPTP